MRQLRDGARIFVGQLLARAHLFGGAPEGERLDVECEDHVRANAGDDGFATLSFRPRPIEETPITAATPMTIPSTVSDDRSLLLRIVSVAMWTISPISLFASQCFVIG